VIRDKQLSSFKEFVMARAFRRPLVARGAKRSMVWIGLSVVQTAVAANTKILLLTLTAGALARRPFTVVRTHVKYSWMSDQVAAFETPTGAFGFIVVNDTASALGVTAVPDPVSDANGNWFVWEGLVYDMVFSAGGFALPQQSIDVDSKAMRKVGADEDVAVVIVNSSASHGARFAAEGRMLVKVH